MPQATESSTIMGEAHDAKATMEPIKILPILSLVDDESKRAVKVAYPP